MWRRIVVVGALLLAAVVIEVTLLSRLGLPGATPDLVVVTVVAIALAMGPTSGAVAGFAAGLLVALAPPGTALMGVSAIVYMAIGYVTGRVIDPRDRTVPILVGIVGLAAGAAALATAALGALLGSDRVDWEQMPAILLTTALYAVVLAPVVILGVAWLVHRITPEAAVS